MPKITKEEKVLLEAAKKVCQYYGFVGDKIVTHRNYTEEAESSLVDLVVAGSALVEHNGTTYFVRDV